MVLSLINKVKVVFPNYPYEPNSNLRFPDDTGFYPDIQDGVMGYNTSESRGADTFHPFKSSHTLRVVGNRPVNTSVLSGTVYIDDIEYKNGSTFEGKTVNITFDTAGGTYQSHATVTIGNNTVFSLGGSGGGNSSYPFSFDITTTISL